MSSPVISVCVQVLLWSTVLDSYGILCASIRGAYCMSSMAIATSVILASAQAFAAWRCRSRDSGRPCYVRGIPFIVRDSCQSSAHTARAPTFRIDGSPPPHSLICRRLFTTGTSDLCQWRWITRIRRLPTAPCFLFGLPSLFRCLALGSPSHAAPLSSLARCHTEPAWHHDRVLSAAQ